MESKKLKRDLIILLVSSFIVIICWIGFNIYSKAVTSTIDESLTKQITPIEPTFDTATINNLVDRQKIDPQYQSEGLPTPTPIPEENPFPTPTLLDEEIVEEDFTQSQDFIVSPPPRILNATEEATLQ